MVDWLFLGCIDLNLCLKCVFLLDGMSRVVRSLESANNT
ncbi:hypothetical protein RSAG8_05557, partial [Rhizoctonia solani AG-8 WAC10335]